MGRGSQGKEETGTPRGLMSESWGRSTPFLVSVSQTVMGRAEKDCAVACRRLPAPFWRPLPSRSSCRVNVFLCGALGSGSPGFTSWWCCWFGVNSGLDGSLKTLGWVLKGPLMGPFTLIFYYVLLWKCSNLYKSERIIEESLSPRVTSY